MGLYTSQFIAAFKFSEGYILGSLASKPYTQKDTPSTVNPQITDGGIK